MLLTDAGLLDHFDRPRGAGGLADDTPGLRRGEAGSEHHGAMVRIDLKCGPDGRIVEVGFKAWGCAATIACASRVSEWATGHTLEDARNLDVQGLVQGFRLPVERLYAPLVVEDALRAAAREE